MCSPVDDEYILPPRRLRGKGFTSLVMTAPSPWRDAPRRVRSGSPSKLPWTLLASLTLILSLAAPIDIPPCRRPSRLPYDVLPQTLDAAVSEDAPRFRKQQQQDDTIVRTSTGCSTPDGYPCDLCCNAKCCEDNDNSFPLFPAGVQAWIPLKIVVILSPSDASMLPKEDLDRRLTEQMQTVNSAYVDKAKFFFYVNETVYILNDTLAASCPTDDCYVSLNCGFYNNIMVPYMANHEQAITIVLCNVPYLGEAQFPWAAVERSHLHYVQVLARIIGIAPPGYSN